jgi:hypothetical protein
MNSYYGMRFSLIGVIFASIGVLVTSLYQVVSCHFNIIVWMNFGRLYGKNDFF